MQSDQSLHLSLISTWTEDKYLRKIHRFALPTYGNGPEISYTDLCKKMAYAKSADQDLTALSDQNLQCLQFQEFCKINAQYKKSGQKSME